MYKRQGQILDTTATDQNNAVLLQVMADTGNVRGDLDTIREADTSNLTQSRVRPVSYTHLLE